MDANTADTPLERGLHSERYDEFVDEERETGREERDDGRIKRIDTGGRVLITLLMAVIWGLAETVLGVIVVFSLLFTLVTEEPPPARLRGFANRLVAYAYRIWRYISYNEARVPFPFSDFPAEIEPPAEPSRDETAEMRALMDLGDDERHG